MLEKDGSTFTVCSEGPAFRFKPSLVLLHPCVVRLLQQSLGLPNSRKGFLTILESETSKISCHQIQCLVRACFPLRQFFTVSSQRKRGQEAFSSLFYKDTNPIHKASSLMTDHHTEVPSPNTITLGHRIQQMNLGRAYTFHL